MPAGLTDPTVVLAALTPTATSVTSSLNPSVYGDAVTFTAPVSPSAASGNVQLEIDGLAVGAPVSLLGGVATLTTSTLMAGEHAVVVSYFGDVTYDPSISPTLAQTVGLRPTATILASSLNPSALGAAVTFTATVSALTAYLPTGTVQFQIDGVAVGAPVTLDATGRARFSTSTLAEGEHAVVASFTGNVNYDPSTSPTLTQTVGSTTATGPAAPTNLRATLLARPTRVSLTWRDNATNEVNFALERSADGGPFTGLATVAARNGTGRQVTFVDTTVAAGSTYRYRVAAVNAAAPSTFSNTVTVVLPSLPGMPTIAGLTAARQSDKERVTVTWNNVAGETGYTIQWSTSSTFATVAGSRTAPANATTFTTRDIERRTWWFRVGATNAAGTVWSAAVSVAAPPRHH
jgi:hypothetical protein